MKNGGLAEEYDSARSGAGNVLFSLQPTMVPGILEASRERGKGGVLCCAPHPSASQCLVSGELVFSQQAAPCRWCPARLPYNIHMRAFPVALPAAFLIVSRAAP